MGGNGDLGFQLRPDALGCLIQSLTASPLTPDEMEDSLMRILNSVRRIMEPSMAPIVDKARLLGILVTHVHARHTKCDLNTDTASNGSSTALNKALQTELQLDLEAVQVSNYFTAPGYLYDHTKKAYVASKETRSLFGSPDARLNMFKNRYSRLYERVKRNKSFRPPVGLVGTASSSSSSSSRYLKVVPIDSLKRTSSNSHENEAGEVLCLLGMLTQDANGRFQLEDMSGLVEIDCSNAFKEMGFFTNGSFVLVHGCLRFGIIVAQSIGFPPAESRQACLEHFPEIEFNFFRMTRKQIEYIHAHSERLSARTSEMVIVLSEVHLDSKATLARLGDLLNGFSGACEQPPLAFLFIGNYLSTNHGISAFPVMKRAFLRLRDLIVQFNNAQLTQLGQLKTQFIFTPGPNDASLSAALPQTVIMPQLVYGFQGIANVHFAGNPSRLRIYNQEIVVFRQNVCELFRREAILPVNVDQTKVVHHHVVRTVVDQAHLMPLGHAAPAVCWELDHALCLDPLPDLLVLADELQQFDTTYEGVKCISPGPFSKSEKFSFYVYYPATRTIDESSIL